MCDAGYFCANFSLPRPLCSRFRPDVRDRQTSDAHHRLMPPTLGARHNNNEKNLQLLHTKIPHFVFVLTRGLRPDRCVY